MGERLVMDIHKGVEIPLYLIKFPLEIGEMEMLVTYLFATFLQTIDFKELY